MTSPQFTDDIARQIVRSGVLWYRGHAPSILVVEDEAPARHHLVSRINDLFRTTCAEAQSIEGALGALSPSEARFDVVVLDHQIRLIEASPRIAPEEELVRFLGKVIEYGKTRFVYLIRITSFRAEAESALQAARSRVVETPGVDSRFECTLDKTKDGRWDNHVLAQIFRSLLLRAVARLGDELNRFDFTRLDGRRPTARSRHGRLDGMEDFDRLVADLQRWWPLMTQWPGSDPATHEQHLKPLLEAVHCHFDVNTAALDLEGGTGDVVLTRRNRGQENSGPGTEAT